MSDIAARIDDLLTQLGADELEFVLLVAEGLASDHAVYRVLDGLGDRRDVRRETVVRFHRAVRRR